MSEATVHAFGNFVYHQPSTKALKLLPGSFLSTLAHINCLMQQNDFITADLRTQKDTTQTLVHKQINYPVLGAEVYLEPSGCFTPLSYLSLSQILSHLIIQS